MTFGYALYIHSYGREIVLNPEHKHDLHDQGTMEIESILLVFRVFCLIPGWSSDLGVMLNDFRV